MCHSLCPIEGTTLLFEKTHLLHKESITMWLTSCFTCFDSTKQINLLIVSTQQSCLIQTSQTGGLLSCETFPYDVIDYCLERSIPTPAGVWWPSQNNLKATFQKSSILPKRDYSLLDHLSRVPLRHRKWLVVDDTNAKNHFCVLHATLKRSS